MINKQTWSHRPHWLDYVKRTWKTGGRVQQTKIDTDESEEFRKRSLEAFQSIGYFPKYVKTYISIQIPKKGEGYDVGYPHIHYPLNAMTLVHYLDAGDIPAPLDIFDDEEVIETIYPVAGLTVFMPNDLKHGVRLNNGTTNRIQMIATGIPCK